MLKAIKDNLNLTFPILLTRLLGMASNFIAMAMMAKLGVEALSASALIMGIFGVCVLLVMSFSFSVCALVAEAHSRNQDKDIGKIIYASILLNTLLSLPFLLIFYFISPLLIFLHQPPKVAQLVTLYFHGMLLGYIPMIWAGILEQFFVGLNKPRCIVYLSMFSLLVMPTLTSMLIFGKWGIPAFGMLGAGLAFSITALLTLMYLLILIITQAWHKKYNLFALNVDNLLVKKLWQLGWPMAIQFAGEFIAYTLITLMMGWVGVIALAAQQVILQFTTIIVMIPTSLSQATAVLVSKAKAAQNIRQIKYQVNIALGIVLIMMSVVAMIYIFMPQPLIQCYFQIDNPKNKTLLSLTLSLLSITALSQCFDGIRNVLAGAYRGLQQTKVPMIVGNLSLWGIAIPLAYYLGFNLHFGAIGVRWGFTIGILMGAITLSLCWFITINKENLSFGSFISYMKLLFSN